ncbi:GNAT family N-acetyltransferase [Clostridium estertheticum]|uniref:GNAT family N-acetyltransferase n=1 Tax=Clostridium estertheticum TaxID=238834 RepID=UPI001C0CB914|nr:GNAT family N-acetyltransferase [Clostridium estertheticum]MBU3200869.1 GNAT family N-acetyltransferase [Clostridium estertheticum]WAG64029.1 GNAT family N-acetyltransferase [Clostridium estertheticum]
MEYIKINGKKYKFIIGTGEDDKFRISFNALTKKTFGFDFEQWYQYGYWKNQFLPYSLMDGDVVVSNVSVNIMNFEVLGKSKRYIQLGTVMTDVAYRNKGLGRVIMEKIIEEWKDKCDLLYLFANDSVLNFYPKFGFTTLNQYQCTKFISKHDKNGLVKKLDMTNKCDRALVYDKANVPSSLAKISMCGNAELIMFYCTLDMTDSVYYIQDYDAVIIANFVGDTIEVLNVFCKEDILLDKMLDYLVDENIKREKLYFTPKETDSYLIKPVEGEGTLFALGEDTLLLANNQFMFPKLSHT